MPHVKFKEVSCLASCGRPLNIGIAGHNKASYIFGDIQTSVDINGALNFAQQHWDSCDGCSNSTERPKALRGKTIARIPVALHQLSKKG